MKSDFNFENIGNKNYNDFINEINDKKEKERFFYDENEF